MENKSKEIEEPTIYDSIIYDIFCSFVVTVGLFCFVGIGYIMAVSKFYPEVLWYYRSIAVVVLTVLGILNIWIGIGYTRYFKSNKVK